MKTPKQTNHSFDRAFTLIEMLVVIAIIAILAAMLFPAFNAVSAKSSRNKARNEIKYFEAAIESYHAKYNQYPPDNPGKPLLNQLFYELVGTVQKGTTFETSDGREQIASTSLNTVFGAGVSGFVNSTRSAGDDAVNSTAKNFLPGMRASNFAFATNGVRYGVLISSVPWPKDKGPVVAGAGFANELNPIRYNASSPTHNKNSYDLWVDIVIRGKTNRISNWNPNYETLN